MSDLAKDSVESAAHVALLYASTDEFAAGALGFLDERLHENEPVLVSAPAPEIGLLRARMNGACSSGEVDRHIPGRR